MCSGNMTTRTTNVYSLPTEGAAMDFRGTWTVYSEENLDEFLKVIGENI